jgi:uncharacterized protein (TIGR02001 family)
VKKIFVRRALLACAVASALAAATAVLAQAKSPHTVTGNVGFVNDYRYRGISQTFLEPAIQGGFDYSHASGFYLGTWASNVYGGSNASGLGVNYFNGNLEWDFYGGYKFDAGPLPLDVGLLHYYYPGAQWGVPTRDKYDNTELYVGATWRWFTAKVSYALTDYFGVKTNTVSGACGVDSNGAATATCAPVNAGGSRGSMYLDLGATFELGGGFNLVGHVGKLDVKNYSLFDYTDYKIGLTKEWYGLNWGLSYIDSNAKPDVYRTVRLEGGGNFTTRDTSKGTLVVSVHKTF